MQISLKKSVVYLLLFVALTTLVYGCRTKAPAPKKDNYDGIELTYYKVFDDGEILDPMIKQYEADHPGLKINYKKFSDFNEYQRTILNEMADGQGPDIFSMQNTWFTSNTKKTTPLPDQFGSVDDFSSTFADVATQDLVHVDDKGLQHVYAVPMTIDSLALYYNKSQFEDRIPSRGRPSKTWEGIKEDVALLNKPNTTQQQFEVSGIAMGRADNISRGVDTLYLLFLQFGTKFYNSNISKATFAGLQVGETLYPGVEALKLLVGFADPAQKHYSWNQYIVDAASSPAQEVEAFAKGQVSMILGYSYSYADIVNQINLLKSKGATVISEKDIGITQVPQLYDPDLTKNKRITYANYFAETVSRNCKYPEIAWDFLLELTKKKNLDAYFKKTHKPTSRRDMIDDQKKDPIYGVFASQIGYAESFPILDYYTYKDLFTQVISKANLVGVANSSLVDAEDKITQMLPVAGFIFAQTSDTAVKGQKVSPKNPSTTPTNGK